MAYADAVRRDLDSWLDRIQSMANAGVGPARIRLEESVNRQTGKLFDEVSVTGLLFCIAEGMPGMDTTDLWEGGLPSGS